MTCALEQNDLRMQIDLPSWQIDLCVILDGMDVLEKMTCALTCALACALTCARWPGVPVAQRKSFSSDSRSMYTKYYGLAPYERWPTIAEAHPLRRFDLIAKIDHGQVKNRNSVDLGQPCQEKNSYRGTCTFRSCRKSSVKISSI